MISQGINGWSSSLSGFIPSWPCHQGAWGWWFLFNGLTFIAGQVMSESNIQPATKPISQNMGFSMFMYVWSCLSGWWFQPLRKILVNSDDYFQYGKIKNVPNHRPVMYVSILTTLDYFLVLSIQCFFEQTIPMCSLLIIHHPPLNISKLISLQGQSSDSKPGKSPLSTALHPLQKLNVHVMSFGKTRCGQVTLWQSNIAIDHFIVSFPI